MTMPQLMIDNREVTVPEGATILDAARRLGIAIPTLCHLDGLPPSTSCMVCLVRVRSPDRLVPSCAALAEDGMIVESETEEVRAARREAMALLLSDHLGDCEAPCRIICPAGLDIPRMLRHLAAGETGEAYALARGALVLPGVLGCICPAPCEKGCRRGEYDAPLAIRASHRFAADAARTAGEAPPAPRTAATGKKVAVVGAGPAGLAAAHHLQRLGHACTIFDERAEAGGRLRDAVPEDRLPRDVLDAEAALVARTGARMRFGVRVGRDVAIGDLAAEFDAVIVAVGEVDAAGAAALGLEASERGIAADRRTRATSRPGVFAAGAAVHKGRMAVRAVADGRAAAESAHQFLCGMPVTGPAPLFSVHIGKVLDGEMERFLAEGSARGRVAPAAGEGAGFTREEAREEAGRCLHCDCRKAETCGLRIHARAYGARGGAAKGERRRFEQRAEHADVLYEPGKCIACGLCVAVAERAREPLGLAFIGRGFDVRVGVPLSRSLAEGLRKAAAECAAACPTGALAMKT